MNELPVRGGVLNERNLRWMLAFSNLSFLCEGRLSKVIIFKDNYIVTWFIGICSSDQGHGCSQNSGFMSKLHISSFTNEFLRDIKTRNTHMHQHPCSSPLYAYILALHEISKQTGNIFINVAKNVGKWNKRYTNCIHDRSIQ